MVWMDRATMFLTNPLTFFSACNIEKLGMGKGLGTMLREMTSASACWLIVVHTGKGVVVTECVSSIEPSKSAEHD